jgi:hypothetical protein
MKKSAAMAGRPNSRAIRALQVTGTILLFTGVLLRAVAVSLAHSQNQNLYGKNNSTAAATL